MTPVTLFIVANPNKPQSQQAIAQLTQSLKPQVTLVGQTTDLYRLDKNLPKADFVLVLGGDGTILSVARSLAAKPIPIIGVNLGKLGYLAEFSVHEVIQHFDQIRANPSLIGQRMMLQIQMTNPDGLEAFSNVAINDLCALAGPPFRMIEIEISVNQQRLTRVMGDGLILCTPTGSTAYNMSAGGPILLSKVHGMVLTPLAPHSLTYRPMVVDSESIIQIKMIRVNEGTTLVIDGQVSIPLAQGASIQVQKHPQEFMLVHNPQYAHWHTLVEKLGWGRSPNYASNKPGN